MAGISANIGIAFIEDKFRPRRDITESAAPRNAF
jgi:hypothetical protein